MRHMHRGLGDAVHVHQPRPCRTGHAITVAVDPVPQPRQIQRLTTEDDIAQRELTDDRAGLGCKPISLGQLIERRRRLVKHRHPLGAQQLQELLRRPRGEVVHHHYRPAEQQRPPQLPHREVERDRMEQRPHIVGAETELPIGVRHQPHHVAMRYQHTLRTTRGTRRIDHIRHVVGRQRHPAVQIGHRTTGTGVEITHRHNRQAVGQRDIEITVDDRRSRFRIRQHELDAFGRIIRVDRHIPGARLDHRQQRHHQIRRTRQNHRNQRVRSGPSRNQLASQTIRPLVQHPVGECLRTESHRDALPMHRHDRIEQSGQRTGSIGERPTAAVTTRRHPVLRHIQPLSGIEHFDVTDGGFRINGEGGQHPHQPVGDPGDDVRIEQIPQIARTNTQAGVQPRDQGQGVMGGIGNVQIGHRHAVDIRRLLLDPFGINGIGLEHDQCVEQATRAGLTLDIDQTEVVVIEQISLLTLGPGQQRASRLGRVETHPHGHGVDEQPDHVLHAVQLRGTAGDGGTEQDIVTTGHAAQHDSPRHL